MAQFLRLAKCVSQTAASTPLTCGCQSVVIGRNGIINYSTKPSTKLETYSRFRRKRGKKKVMTDREVLHQQLSRTLDARLVQLVTSTGSSTHTPGYCFHGDIIQDVHRLKLDIDTVASRMSKGHGFTSNGDHVTIDSMTAKEVKRSNRLENNNVTLQTEDSIMPNQSGTLKSVNSKSLHVQDSQKSAFLHSEFSDSVQKEHFESTPSQSEVYSFDNSIVKETLPSRTKDRTKGKMSSLKKTIDVKDLSDNEMFGKLESTITKSAGIKPDKIKSGNKKMKTSNKSVISETQLDSISVINPRDNLEVEHVIEKHVSDKIESKVKERQKAAQEMATDRDSVSAKNKKRKSSTSVYERKNENLDRKQKKLQSEQKLPVHAYKFDPNSVHTVKQVFKYKPPEKAPLNMTSFAGSRDDFMHSDNNVISEAVAELEVTEEPDEAWEGLEESELDEDVLDSLRHPQAPGKLMSLSELRRWEHIKDPFHEDDQFDMFDVDFKDSSKLHEDSGSIEGFITNKAKDKYTAKLNQIRAKLRKQNKRDFPAPAEASGRNLTEHDLELKKAKFNSDLESYVDACVMCGLTRRAFEDLQFYSTKNKHIYQVTNVNIYNTLLRGLVKEGFGLEEVRMAFSYIKEAKLQPTMETYAICLASVGHKTDYDTMLATFIVKDMRKQGLDVEDIFNQCLFLHNERHAVYKVLKAVIPNFTPKPPKLDARFEGSLLEPLNSALPLEEVVDVNPLSGSLPLDKILQKTEVQFEREMDGYVAIDSIMKVKHRKHHHVDKLRENWQADVKKALEERVEKLRLESFVKPGINLYPFFCLFPLDDYVNIILKEVEHLALLSQYQSPPIAYLHKILAERVFQRYLKQQMIHTDVYPKLYKAYSAYIDHLANPYQPVQNQRHLWQQLIHNISDGNSMEIPEKNWSIPIRKRLGQELMDIILTSLEVDSNCFIKASAPKMVKCFYMVQRDQRHKLSLQIKPHPILCHLFNPEADLMMPTDELPMVCPPVPYTSIRQGCNFSSTVPLVRYCTDQQMKQLGQNQDAAPMLDSLNVVGAVAWRINKPIFDVVVKIFRSGGNPDLSVPLLPSKLERPVPVDMDDHTARKQYYRDMDAYRKEYSEVVSLWWCDLYRLSIADKFKDEVLWFPLNMDFRGRTYPIAPHLNHQGPDVIRGMMLFAKGKPLGEEGLDWLKIHLVNLTSLKKRASNAERLAYADEIMPDILDSADNPLDGNRWWMTSDEPWQTLAACKEVAAAVRSGDPATYVSHLPVHQDGSCNGLQHYAALGRDTKGAQSVNLHPYDKPTDVYSEVVDLVRKEIERDVADTSENNKQTRQIALIAGDYLERKVIKQSIMTTVYGVTIFGANLQIRRQLEDKDIPEEHLHAVSAYLTRKTFKCLDQMFTSAKAIEKWFGACTWKISSTGEPTEWVTPLKFPVIQPYFKEAERDDDTMGLKYSDMRLPHRQKQKNGFAPNFIHSLDATHMALTALYCYRKGITFTSVHDCFWTHPCDIPVMNKITREQFLALHNEPILHNLSSFFINRFIDRHSMSQDEVSALYQTFTRVPERGAFELEKVLDSTYFFS